MTEYKCKCEWCVKARRKMETVKKFFAGAFFVVIILLFFMAAS